MSSKPDVAMSVAMFSARRFPSGAAMSALKSPATISSASHGFFRIAATTLYIVSVSLGAMYAPTMYHRRAPVANWKPSTLGPNFSTASTTKWGSER